MQKRRYMIYGILLMSCWLGLNACIEQITFPIVREGGQLIIDGSVSDASQEQILRIGEAANSSRIPIPISTAQAWLYDDLGNVEAYVYNPEDPGTYVLPGDIVKGEVGRTYYVEVELENGSRYRSEPEKMLGQPGKMDSIYYDFTREQRVSESSIVFEDLFINVFIDVDLTQADTSDYFLRWDVEEVYLLTPTDFPDPFGMVPPPCYVYVFTSGGSLNLFESNQSPRQYLQKVQVATQEVNKTFREKHYFSVFQRSMNREAYEYWEKIDQVISSVGSIFDTPPAPIPGNVHNINDPDEVVLGYFYSASSQVIRFRTFRNDIPIDQILECTYSPSKFFSDYPRECLNCISVRNSTYARPDFF